MNGEHLYLVWIYIAIIYLIAGQTAISASVNMVELVRVSHIYKLTEYEQKSKYIPIATCHIYLWYRSNAHIV